MTPFPALVLAAIFITEASALNLQVFAQCIGAQGQGPVCQLDAGTYSIATQLTIGRSNITIKGTIVTSRSDTVLQRAAGYSGALFRDQNSAAGTPILSAITVRDLTIDGNRSQNTGLYSSYQPELNFFSTASLLFTNCDFINSPNISLAFYGAGTQGVVVNNSHFGNPVIYGLWSNAPGNNSGQNYLTCASKQFVNNVIVANCQFDNAGEPSILGNMTNIQLRNNVFTNNHSFPVPFDDDGGQIDLTECASGAAIVGNTFQNASAASTGHVVQGVELHGVDMVLVDNTIINNSGDAVSIGGGANIFLANWNQATAATANAGGVSFYQGTTNDSARPVDFISLDSAIITNNTKWGLWSMTSGVPINHVSVTNSCLKNNRFGVSSLSGLGTDVTIQSNPLSGCLH